MVWGEDEESLKFKSQCFSFYSGISSLIDHRHRHCIAINLPAYFNFNLIMNYSRAILYFSVIISGIPVILWPILLSFVSLELPLDLTNSSISLLIAHPDDEAMFFGPTLSKLSLPEYNNNVTIICFSSGNFDGIGHVRKQELLASAQQFNVPASNVRLIDDPQRFPDSQEIHWNTTILASEISSLLSPETKILTFDRGGVSGHNNHRSIYEASQLEKATTGRELFVLRSLPTWRKYLFVADGLISYISSRANPDQSSILILSTRQEATAAQTAMITAHKSQMRWFRYGWIYLSRYMVVNDLVRS